MAAPIDISFEIDDTVSAAIDQAIAGIADMTPVMKDIAGELDAQTRLRFEEGKSPAGVPWKPSERVKEHGGQTLVLSGDLANSIRPDWGADYAAAGPEASGGAAVYAAIHQFGGTIVPRHKQALAFGGRIVSRVVMPARPYLGWNDETQAYAVDTLSAYIARLFGAQAGGAA